MLYFIENIKKNSLLTKPVFNDRVLVEIRVKRRGHQKELFLNVKYIGNACFRRG